MPERAGAAPGRALGEIARTMRGALGSLRAAAETLEKYPAMDGASHARLLGVIAEEAERLGDLVRRLEQIGPAAAGPAGQAGSVRATTVAELAEGLAEAAEGLGFEVTAGHAADAALAAVGLDLPGTEAIDAVAAFLARLRREMAVARVRLGVERVDRHLLLDLAWSPDAGDLARLLDWQAAALDAPTADAGVRGLRPLVRDHDGEAWFLFERDGAAAHVKVLLPLAEPAPAA